MSYNRVKPPDNSGFLGSLPLIKGGTTPSREFWQSFWKVTAQGPVSRGNRHQSAPEVDMALKLELVSVMSKRLAE
jgi:hypothetical protein